MGIAIPSPHLQHAVLTWNQRRFQLLRKLPCLVIQPQCDVVCDVSTSTRNAKGTSSRFVWGGGGGGGGWEAGGGGGVTPPPRGHSGRGRAA
jgi:hypothetical protein